MKPLSLNWNLETIFEGGVESASFQSFLHKLTNEIREFGREIDAATGLEMLVPLVQRLQELLLQVRQAEGFVTCLKAQSQSDRRAVLLGGKVKAIQAEFGAAQTRFDQLLLGLSDEQWRELLDHESLREVAFPLQERRARAAEKLSPALEALIGQLALDGYHGWSDLYLTIVGRLRVPFGEGEAVQQLSIGQAENKLQSAERETRAALFESFEASWGEAEDLCADALNHLAGFRWRVTEQRGWDSILKEPLEANRITARTLEAMWDAVENRIDRLVPYLQHKAARLGVEKPSWHDVEVPLTSPAKLYPYNQAAQLVIDGFARFDPQMGQFAQRALEHGWVDAEMRPGKRNGGFSKTLPLSGQSRVFLNFGGSLSNIKTLAHELGHAYHQDLMKNLPALSQRYAMTVAETASTFAEQLVVEHALNQARDAGEKLLWLEASAQGAVSYLMNIRARFLFEIAFYDERKAGYVSVERLGELSVQAQKTAFGEALADYHPHFWAARRHFFFTNQPFYNFPYTFGFLLSAGLYAFALQSGPNFGEKYAQFLRDSGTMTVELLAATHLGADVEGSDFWLGAVDVALEDVDRFLEASR